MPDAPICTAEIVQRFRRVSIERLEFIETSWIRLSHSPDEKLAAEVRRALHTLKGDARVVGFADVALLCHKTEDLFACAEQRHFQVPPDFDLLVTMAVRFMTMLTRKQEGMSLGGIDLAGFLAQVDSVLREHEGPRQVQRTTLPPPPDMGDETKEDQVAPGTYERLAEAATAVFVEHLLADEPARSRLRDAWITMSDKVTALGHQPLALRLATHVGSVLELARDLNKKVHLVADVQGLRLPARVADSLELALLHVLHNAVEHGVEDPATRRLSGKSSVGTIRIAGTGDDEWIEVSVEDDGRGIDLAAVRRRAVERQLLRESEAARIGDDAILELLAKGQLSTAPAAGALSRSGIGLGAARAALERVGGELRVRRGNSAGAVTLLRVPRNSACYDVHAFPAAGRDLLLAVTRDWSLSGYSGPDAIDPLVALGMTPTPAAPIGLLLSRGDERVRLLGGGTPSARVAERRCTPPPRYPVEVVVIDGREALLLRPTAFVSG